MDIITTRTAKSIRLARVQVVLRNIPVVIGRKGLIRAGDWLSAALLSTVHTPTFTALLWRSRARVAAGRMDSYEDESGRPLSVNSDERQALLGKSGEEGARLVWPPRVRAAGRLMPLAVVHR